MTNYNKATLATFFETNDVPQGSDYANLINSQVNIVETAAQAMAGSLQTTKLIAPLVSATNINATAIVSAVSLYATNVYANNLTAVSSNITFNNIVAAGSITASAVNSGTGTFSGLVSANALNVATDVSAATGTVYASAARISTAIFHGVGIVSAAGTTQGTAAVLTNTINRGKGIADGSTTGFTPPGNNTGRVQYLFNEGVSANLWPPTGGTINGLAVNAAFPLAASAMVTIIHLTASAMAAK